MNGSTFIIADNQDVTRAGVRSFICQNIKGAHITDVFDKRGLIQALSQDYTASVSVILDYTIFDLNGLDDILILSKRAPATIWILFSTELSDDFIRHATLADNISLVLKDCQSSEIISALTNASKGENYICHQIKSHLNTDRQPGDSPMVHLTNTETEILKLIALGKSVKEIAAIRVSSTHTVITHKKNIFRKLNVNNVYEATRYALRAGLVEMMEYYI